MNLPPNANDSKPMKHFSEISLLKFDNSNLACFTLNHSISKEIGNRFSWRFCHKFPNIVVVFEQSTFWALAKEGGKLPQSTEWKEALLEIQEELRKDIGEHYYSIQWRQNLEIAPMTEAQLAARVLKVFCHFPSPVVFPKENQEQNVQVKREVEFWAEEIEINNQLHPALTLSAKSVIIYSNNLTHFFENHPRRHEPEKILVGLSVKDIEKNSSARIIKIGGVIKDHKDSLLQMAKGAISRKSLEEADDDQPIVVVKFGRNPQEYPYPLAALRPYVTDKTAYLFQVEYGNLLKETKMSYSERQSFLKTCKQKAQRSLSEFGIEISHKNLNSMENPELFWIPSTPLENTPILFGNNVKGEKNSVLKGLSNGGVYFRHAEYSESSRKIRLAFLKPSNFEVAKFLTNLQTRLKKYKFDTLLPEENKKSFSLEGLSGSEQRVKIEEAMDELLQQSIPTDIVLVFLPQSDRDADNTEEGSLYSWIKEKLLRQGIMAQGIYEKTLYDPENIQNDYRFILNETVQGILGKLGNIPYVLADPLEVVDYFIGLDVSRSAKKKSSGSINVCASVRFYGRNGQFVRFRVEDGLTEGEEIHQRTLEKFLPQSELKNKKILIYRDGKFQGNEVKNILERSKAINLQCILVECFKSGISRLYNFDQKQLSQPSKGLAMRLSSSEVILVTTQIKDKVGIPRPIRLKVNELGESIDLQTLVDTTLKLTLLHYGSLKDVRLPVPLYDSDIIAYRRLQGICPGLLEDDRQFWL